MYCKLLHCRYLAIRHPLQYRNAEVQTNHKRQAILTILFVMFVALIVCIPLLFEAAVVYDTYQLRRDLNTTHMLIVSPLLCCIFNNHGPG